MSRIDQALQRAQTAGTAVGPSPEEQSELFVSAWDEPPPRALRPVSAPAPQADQASFFAPAAHALMPSLGSQFKERVAASDDCDPALVEQFRRLAATLHSAQTASGIKTILVASPSPGEGKTLTALNLALVLSRSYGRRVLLVDADLRRPSISELIGVTGSVGLSTALRSKADARLTVIPLSPTLTLLPAGPPDPDPLGGLTSERMKQILVEARARFDWVILDGPPIGGMAEAGLLAQIVEGTLLVLRAGLTAHASADKAISAIGRERILGVVLNGSTAEGPSAYAPYYRKEIAAGESEQTSNAE